MRSSSLEVHISRASAVVVQQVPAALVDWFMEWQSGVTGAAEGFAGYGALRSILRAKPSRTSGWW